MNFETIKANKFVILFFVCWAFIGVFTIPLYFVGMMFFYNSDDTRNNS